MVAPRHSACGSAGHRTPGPLIHEKRALCNQTKTGTASQEDRALFADPNKQALLSAANRTDLTQSIGTVLSNIQLSSLTHQQLDELALLVAERGVVLLRNQDLSREAQSRVARYYGTVDSRPNPVDDDHSPRREVCPQSEWHSDKTYEIRPPSYSLFKVEGTPAIGGYTAWVSQYGLYDSLSKPMRAFFDGLQVAHKLPRRSRVASSAPVGTLHPAVCTHPVTGFRALNLTPSSVNGFAELKKKESDKLLELLDSHIHSSVEHTVGWHWETGTVAIWDNRCTAYRLFPGTWSPSAMCFGSVYASEKPYFDSASEGREEHEERLAQEAREKEELRLTKARFNSTPLRRILLRQVFGEQHNGDQVMEGTGRQVVTESDDTLRADSVVSEDGANLKTSVVIESREERTERWTLEVRAEVRHRKPASARKSNTPLRRIIERQAVLSLEGKLECH